MAETNDFTSEVQRVRAFIPDIEKLQNPNRPGSDPEYIFSDEHLRAFLDENGGNVKLAAADACEVLGTSEALILKVITTEDLSTDGAKLMNAYIIRAQQMRNAAKTQIENEDGGFTIVPYFLVPSHYEPVS